MPLDVDVTLPPAVASRPVPAGRRAPRLRRRRSSTALGTARATARRASPARATPRSAYSARGQGVLVRQRRPRAPARLHPRLDPSRRRPLRGARHPVPRRPARRRGHREARRIGVTGASYGGGQSLMLATLRDRTMLPDGRLVPWRSPEGKPMRIAAAAPKIGWSDLAYALVPTGRTLDYRAPQPLRRATSGSSSSPTSRACSPPALRGYYAPPGRGPGGRHRPRGRTSSRRRRARTTSGWSTGSVACSSATAPPTTPGAPAASASASRPRRC